MGKLRHKEITVQRQLVRGKAKMLTQAVRLQSPHSYADILCCLSTSTVTKVHHFLKCAISFTHPGLHLVLNGETCFRS